MTKANGLLHKSSGLTILEMAISLAILSIVLTSAFTLGVKSMDFIAENDDVMEIQTEGSRAFSRLAELLRKSGRVDIGGISYPFVANRGKELHFRLPADLDGNGFPFDGATGDLEWDPRVFVARTDLDGGFHIFSGANELYSLGRYISNLKFETINENNALHLKETRISFEVRKPASKGFELTYPVEASVHLRN